MRIMLGMLGGAVLAASFPVGALAQASDEDWIGSAQLVRVKPGTKRFFHSIGDERPGCTADLPCPRKAFVLPGDVLVAGTMMVAGRDGTRWQEVEFVGANGRATQGWIRAADLDPFTPVPATARLWNGEWKRVEASINFGPGPQPNTLQVKGDATWGAEDPERVKRGGVHIGEIEGSFTLANGQGGFAMGEDGSKPWDQADEYECRARFRLLHPYLLVEDNGQCGGLNVSFTGTYVRKAAAPRRPGKK